jgi:hypothetical protein
MKGKFWFRAVKILIPRVPPSEGVNPGKVTLLIDNGFSRGFKGLEAHFCIQEFNYDI